MARAMTARSRAYRWLPVAAVTAAIFVESSHDISIPFSASVDEVMAIGFHMTVFFLLAFFSQRALAGEGFSPRKAALGAVLVAVCYGVADELHQSLTPGRDPSTFDVFVDFVGALAGSRVGALWGLRRRRWASKDARRASEA